jgi:Fe2+ or Zn2+ uptake regulation protein
MIQLRNLARGHASSQGRNYITTNDIPIIIEVVLSTASRERVIIFDCLLKNKGQLTTKEIEESLHITTPTALRTMTEFTALELVNKLSLGSEVNAPIQIQLKQEFDWFLTDEFKKSRDGFGNEYINEYLQEKESKKSKIEIKDINNYEEYKEKISPTLNNFYDIKRQEYLEENYPIMVYNKNNFAIQPY